MNFHLNDAQKALVNLADRLGREAFAPKAARWDRDHEYPHENVETLRRNITCPCEKAGRAMPRNCLVGALLGILLAGTAVGEGGAPAQA